MKIAAILVLLFPLVVAVVAAPWIFLPVLAGLLTAWALYLKPAKRPGFQKFLNATRITCVALAVMIAGWFFLNTPWKAHPASFATPANGLIAGLTAAQTTAAATAQPDVDAARIALRAAFQRERQKVQLIREGLALHAAAQAQYQTLSARGGADEALADALKTFEAAFKATPGDNAARMMNSNELDALATRAFSLIDKVEGDDLARHTDRQTLVRAINDIASDLGALQLNAMYIAVTVLQERLKNSLKVQMAPQTVYWASYDRDADTLTAVQQTRMQLGSLTATQVDLTGFVTSRQARLAPDLIEQVSVQEDASPPQDVPADKPLYALSRGVKELVVTRRMVRQHASRPVLEGRLPLQFVEVPVDWPLLTRSSITFSLQEGDGAGPTWPYVQAIDVKDKEVLDHISVPGNALFFVDPPMPVSSGDPSDQLKPDATQGNLHALVPGSDHVIRVQLLPRYLSNKVGQDIKDYLATENMAAALLWWLITVVGIGLLKPSSS